MTTQVAVRIPDGIVRALDDAIVDGYTRIPPTDAETAWAGRSSQDMLAEEPW